MQPTPRFPRRRRLDGSYASICPRCYVTVGSADTADDQALTLAEQNHVCDPEILAWLSGLLTRSMGKWEQ